MAPTPVPLSAAFGQAAAPAVKDIQKAVKVIDVLTGLTPDLARQATAEIAPKIQEALQKGDLSYQDTAALARSVSEIEDLAPPEALPSSAVLKDATIAALFRELPGPNGQDARHVLAAMGVLRAPTPLPDEAVTQVFVRKNNGQNDIVTKPGVEETSNPADVDKYKSRSGTDLLPLKGTNSQYEEDPLSVLMTDPSGLSGIEAEHAFEDIQKNALASGIPLADTVASALGTPKNLTEEQAVSLLRDAVRQAYEADLAEQAGNPVVQVYFQERIAVFSDVAAYLKRQKLKSAREDLLELLQDQNLTGPDAGLLRATIRNTMGDEPLSLLDPDGKTTSKQIQALIDDRTRAAYERTLEAEPYNSGASVYGSKSQSLERPLPQVHRADTLVDPQADIKARVSMEFAALLSDDAATGSQAITAYTEIVTLLEKGAIRPQDLGAMTSVSSVQATMLPAVIAAHKRDLQDLDIFPEQQDFIQGRIRALELDLKALQRPDAPLPSTTIKVSALDDEGGAGLVIEVSPVEGGRPETKTRAPTVPTTPRKPNPRPPAP